MPSVELSDTRRRGSRNGPPDASEARSARGAGEAKPPARRRIAPQPARQVRGSAAAGSGNETEAPRNATNTTRTAKGGHGRGRKPGRPKHAEADCAGLRPDGVLVYAEWSKGRAIRPAGTGSTVAPTVAALGKAGRGKSEK